MKRSPCSSSVCASVSMVNRLLRRRGGKIQETGGCNTTTREKDSLLFRWDTGAAARCDMREVTQIRPYMWSARYRSRQRLSFVWVTMSTRRGSSLELLLSESLKGKREYKAYLLTMRRWSSGELHRTLVILMGIREDDGWHLGWLSGAAHNCTSCSLAVVPNHQYCI